MITCDMCCVHRRVYTLRCLPWWLSGKTLPTRAGDPGLIPGSGRSPGGGNGRPLQYSCLENPIDRGTWRATLQGVAKESTRLSEQTDSMWLIYSIPMISMLVRNITVPRYHKKCTGSWSSLHPKTLNEKWNFSSILGQVKLRNETGEKIFPPKI